MTVKVSWFWTWYPCNYCEIVLVFEVQVLFLSCQYVWRAEDSPPAKERDRWNPPWFWLHWLPHQTGCQGGCICLCVFLFRAFHTQTVSCKTANQHWSCSLCLVTVHLTQALIWCWSLTESVHGAVPQYPSVRQEAGVGVGRRRGHCGRPAAKNRTALSWWHFCFMCRVTVI